MCDYSLHTVASRPAKVGDKLISTSFRNSITRGFAAIDEPRVAVCLLPGTEIAFEEEVEYHHPFRRLVPMFRYSRITGKVARFRHVNLSDPNAHHDALEFPSGEIVLLTRLREGQRATVLQLPAGTTSSEAQERRDQDAEVTKRPVRTPV